MSSRTIYRDIKVLEEAGKGYSLVEGYRTPPVMFTEREALALTTAEKWVLANQDASFIQAFKVKRPRATFCLHCTWP